MWNKKMDYEGLKHYANYLINKMENETDDYKYMELEEILFGVQMDLIELEEQEQQ